MTQKPFYADTGLLRRTGRGIRVDGSRKDQDDLESIMVDAIAYSPTAREALRWAESVGVRIICSDSLDFKGAYSSIDKNIKINVGTHTSGADLVNTLVHEIRHMWHDDKGLLSDGSLVDTHWRLDPTRRVAQNALYEADACAHGHLAALEFMQRGPVRDAGCELQKYFKLWFQHARTNDPYRQRILIGYGIGLPQPAVQKVVANLRKVFGLSVKAVFQGVDPYCVRTQLRLGDSFAGVNYMARLLRTEPDFLPRVLQATALLTNYVSPQKLPKRVCRAIKAHKREKLQMRGVRYPLPVGVA